MATKARDADERPGGLVGGQVLVDPGDEHVAEAVEQQRRRAAAPVGAAGQEAGGDVGDEQEADDDHEEREDVGREVGGAAEAGERVGATVMRAAKSTRPSSVLRRQRPMSGNGRGGRVAAPWSAAASWSVVVVVVVEVVVVLDVVVVGGITAAGSASRLAT